MLIKNYDSAVTDGQKAIVALTLAVASIAIAIPETVNADAPPGNYCVAGDAGDCDELSSAPSVYVCTQGAFWNDCQ